ncbi:transcriptional regulator, AraC family [Dyadobacter koreensis]|uniref:Transcriptional regulator, AraC family n=1 Tax=Dyadobacter koreensis TaxID=408657 RepID=A0A1H6YTB2_9BACT|nr:helix-turn-helix domain-containing protein [Dyadobacter koreensis]SEJ40512.1 transcriptional regulator, AraC family [Dyadobacter koreensis]
MEFIAIDSISELHDFFRHEKPLHPLISVVDLEKVDRSHRRPGVSYRLNLYSIACKVIEGEFKYGRTSYDFSEGTLMFTAPDQILNPGLENKVKGWGIYIHPDFFKASNKGSILTGHTFFGYDIHEALHISETEKIVLEDCARNIRKEISINLDRHSYNIILTNLELALSYCARFYDRQFLTRGKSSSDLLEKFERMLTDYFSQTSPIESGIPDIGYFADRLNLSPNYLSDLLKRYTGKSTYEHIQIKLVDKAKTLLWSTENSISEIAYDLGFEHPSHFTKVFKNRTGFSPRDFRNQSQVSTNPS